MAPSSTLCIGMDVHPDPIAVAYVAQAHGAAGTSLGPMGTRQCDSDHLVRTMLSKAKPLLCVSDAGPCGDGLSRYLKQKDDDGGVVAPSRMPQTAGDRVTTNRRDAVPLARLARAGALPAVYVPQGEAAAMRALTRAREETLSECQDAQCRRKAFLLRPDSRSSGPANWGPAPRRWLAEVVCPTPAQPSGCQASSRAVTAHPERLQRLDQARPEHVHAWRFHAVVEALQALRGVPCTVAVTLGALTRLDTPRALMQFLGLLPAADASGGATSTGRAHLSWPHPGPTGARGRRLGLPLSRPGASPWATAPRNPPQDDAGQQLESPR
jgi:transposase